MPFKPVGVDENNKFPARVETRLASTFRDRGVTFRDLPTSGIISAHRGSSADWRPVAPEGSMSAYRLAVAQGAHIIDVDYQATADGVPVSLHDTTVDRTTASTGALNTFAQHQLPPVHMPEYVGAGWAAEPIPTVDQILAEFGGRVCITVEAKGGAAAVPALAALIHKHDLADSVYINGPTTAIATAATAAGCLAHQYGVTDAAGVAAAAAAGADLIELPHTASTTLVDTALASGIHRVIAAPIYRFSELSAMTTGLQGYVTDALGYLNRPGGVNTRSVPSLAGAVATGRRGAGWKRFGNVPLTVTDFATTDGVLLRGQGTNNGYMFGDLSGSVGTTGSISFRFSMPTLPTDTSNRVALRVLAPEEDGTAVDGDTRGYVFGLRANGTLNLWSSVTGYGAATSLGAPTGTALVAGTTYEVLFEWTATQVRATRVDTGVTTGWINDTLWRSNYIYATTTMQTGEARIKNVIVT